MAEGAHDIAKNILGSVSGGVSSVFSEVTASLGKLGPEAELAVIAFNQLTEIVGKAWGAFKDMLKIAGAADPVQMERFQQAQTDATAVIGRMFVPMLEKATDVVRLVGDVLATILPTAGEVREQLKSLDPVLQDLRQIAADLGPVLREMAIAELKAFALMLKYATINLQQWMAPLKLLGLGGGGGSLKSSFGAGEFRTPTMTSDIAGVKTQFMTEALRVSAGAGQTDPAERTAKASEESNSLLQQILSALKPSGEGILGAGAAMAGRLMAKLQGPTPDAGVGS